MASNRHLGRIVALQSLYEYEFRLESADTTVDIDEILTNANMFDIIMHEMVDSMLRGFTSKRSGRFRFSA